MSVEYFTDKGAAKIGIGRKPRMTKKQSLQIICVSIFAALISSGVCLGRRERSITNLRSQRYTSASMSTNGNPKIVPIENRLKETASKSPKGLTGIATSKDSSF